VSDQSAGTPVTPSPKLEAPLTKSFLLERHEPWLTADLRDFLDAASWIFGQVELYTFDAGEDWGWTVLYDPARCPPESLPHLAQYVGEVLPAGSTVADQRTLISGRAHMRRGTPWAISASLKPYLTGAQAVLVTERYGGVADELLVNTYGGQTPDPTQVLEVLKSVIPADVRLTYVTSAGQIWNTVKTTNATWQAVKTKYPTWNGVVLDTPGA
jgi:tail protein P2 I